MGVQIAEVLPKKEIELSELAGRKVAIDAFNTLYQFLSIIRDRFTGEPLKDKQGRITSHLSGLFYRTVNLVEAGVKPVFVFDGKPPAFKYGTIENRVAIKEVAKKKWEDAVKAGENGYKYAIATSHLSKDMAEESKKLLDLMGVPWVQAPSEGEAQCSYMCKSGQVFAAGSQDSDSLLFGSPRLVRNLSITGKRKLPKKELYIDVKPELIELKNVLAEMGLTREQLIVVGMLVGTDYNPGGIRGLGPKKSLKLVKEQKTLEKVLQNIEWNSQTQPNDIFEFFMNPPTTDDYKLEWKQPNVSGITKLLVDEHDFSIERIEKSANKLSESYSKSSQSGLKSWLK